MTFSNVIYISEGILSNQKIIVGLDSFYHQRLIFWPHLDNTSLCTDFTVESCKIRVIVFGYMLPSL